MSKRIDITSQIFNDIFVLEFIENKNSHAKYKCLCMNCNSIIFTTYSNLISGNTKSCQSCGQKRTSNGVEQDIFWELRNGSKIVHVAKNYNVGRGVVYRIKKECGL
jgi:hypothetical protein